MAAKKSNTGLRMMMATASLVGFLGGWVMLGHAPKPGLPVASSTSASTSTSNGTGLGSSQIQSSGGLTQLPGQSLNQTSRTRLRTGGS